MAVKRKYEITKNEFFFFTKKKNSVLFLTNQSIVNQSHFLHKTAILKTGFRANKLDLLQLQFLNYTTYTVIRFLCLQFSYCELHIGTYVLSEEKIKFTHKVHLWQMTIHYIMSLTEYDTT